MIVIASSPLLSYLSYEVMASDGWLEGYFIGSQSSHGRIEEGMISNDSPLHTVRITSFTRIGSHSPAVYSDRPNEVPEGAVGWFRYRHGSTRRLSVREAGVQSKLSRGNPNFVFCLVTRELKGDVNLTLGLNFSFFTVSQSEGPLKKIDIQPVQLMIANPDDSLQPAYPFFQIEHSFSVPWVAPENSPGRDSPGRQRDSFKRAVNDSLVVVSLPTDPSQQLADFTKESYRKMLARLNEVATKVQSHDSLIDL